MHIKTLTEAIKLAADFIVLAETVRDQCLKNEQYQGYISGSKESGATQRASMELTRKLSQLRASK